jgi:hypothetical protein
MNYKIENYNEIENKLDLLDSSSDNVFYFIPENINENINSSEYIYTETTTDIRKLFKSENIDIEYLTNDRPLLRSRKSADWFGPTLFITFSLLSENSTMIGISLNLISSYLYDNFKGITGNKKVKFEIIIESKKKKEYKKINYEGSIEGIKELESLIKQLKK